MGMHFSTAPHEDPGPPSSPVQQCLYQTSRPPPAHRGRQLFPTFTRADWRINNGATGRDSRQPRAPQLPCRAQVLPHPSSRFLPARKARRNGDCFFFKKRNKIHILQTRQSCGFRLPVSNPHAGLLTELAREPRPAPMVPRRGLLYHGLGHPCLERCCLRNDRGSP